MSSPGSHAVVRGSRRKLPVGPLREKRFRTYFIGQVGSDIGSALASVAFAFAILEFGDSATDLGWVMGARVAPLLVITIIGGVWIDRLPRERVLVWTRLVSGVSQGLTAFLLLTDTAHLGLLIGLAFVTGAAGTLWVPASAAVMPTLVPPELLREANALRRLVRNGISITGAAAGGLLATAIDPSWTLVADSISFFASAAILSALPVTRAHLTGTARRFSTELREGWSEFVAQDWLWPVVLQFMVINIMWSAGYTLIGPLIARERLGGPAAWGAILAANSIGMILGGLVALRFRPKRSIFSGVALVATLAGPLAAIAAGGGTWIIAATALVAGAGMELFEVQYAYSMQRNIPQEKMARVAAYDGLVSFGALPLGYALAGPAITRYGVSSTSAVAAGAILVATLLTLAAPGVRQLTDSIPEPTSEKPARSAPIPPSDPVGVE